MKNLKIFFVTYKRQDVLNESLNTLFHQTDFLTLKDTEVNIINNHSEFYLDPTFRNQVNVINNEARPDWDLGNLSRSWNQALLHGFKDLNNPDANYVVTMQNDIVLDAKWASNLMQMHKKYNFVTGHLGDNIISYTPEAVKNIGMWDERFLLPVNKEADYYIRALIYNKNKSLINDTAHGRTLNNHDALSLDKRYRGGEPDWAAHKQSKNTRDAWHHTSQIFYYKWKDTWKEQPAYRGWLTKWSADFVKNPPCTPKSPSFVQYYYFEKDINLLDKNYVGWRKEDYWFDHTGRGDAKI